MVRIKHRYLLINILYPAPSFSAFKTSSRESISDIIQFHAPTSDKLTNQLLARMIRDGVGELFGEWGAGMIAGSLKIIYLSAATSTAIIRVSRDHYRLVWAALTFVTKLPKPIEEPCAVKILRCSGTIRKAEEEAVRRAKVYITKARQQGYGDVDMLKNRMGGKEVVVERDAMDIMSESDESG